MAAYFRLKQASSYAIRTPKSRYTFADENTVVRVVLNEDIAKLRGKPDVIEECDQKGLPLLDSPSKAKSSATSGTLSYTKLAKKKAPKPAALPVAPKPVAPPVAPPAAPVEEEASTEEVSTEEVSIEEKPFQPEADLETDGEASEAGPVEETSSGKAKESKKSKSKKSGKRGRRKSE